MRKIAINSTSGNAPAALYRLEPSVSEMSAEMRRFAEKLKADKSAARDFFVKAGIVTRNGNLRKPYGG